MSHTGGYGRGGLPPFDHAAASAIGAIRGQGSPWVRTMPPPPLTAGERAEAQQAADAACTLCAGIHPLPATPACPRVATFRLDGDGKLVEGTFWGPDTNWWEGRVVFVADVHEDGDGDGGN